MVYVHGACWLRYLAVCVCVELGIPYNDMHLVIRSVRSSATNSYFVPFLHTRCTVEYICPAVPVIRNMMGGGGGRSCQ